MQLRGVALATFLLLLSSANAFTVTLNEQPLYTAPRASVATYETPATLESTYVPPAVQEKAVINMVGRILGSTLQPLFSVRVLPNLDVNRSLPPKDRSDEWFSYYAENGRLNVDASSGPAAGAGLHHYMKRHMNASVTWGADGSGIHVPAGMKDFPPADYKRQRSLGSLRYYYNVCTYGYTMAFWTWKRWEEQIDWMALHGINLPLASEGQEYIWWKTFTQHFNLTTEEVTHYFTGPAYLSWMRMGNIHTWGGPMSVAFMRSRAELQKLILQRMREFGMKPVLPAFAGFVPSAFAKKFNHTANFSQAPSWGLPKGYTSNWLLEPTSSLFSKVGQTFLKELTAEFGVTDYYSADTWNEMVPPTNNSGFVHNSSKAIVDAIRGVNKDGIWVMQGWLFVSAPGFWNDATIEAYLGGAPKSNLLILDLTSEWDPVFKAKDSYFGYSFIWCLLHNYGGRRGIYGNLTHFADRIHGDYYEGDKMYTMAGVGLTMEATEQNPVVYELAMSAAFSHDKIELESWLREYARSRYGSEAMTSVGAFAPLIGGNNPYATSVFCCMDFSSATAGPFLGNRSTMPLRSLISYDPDPLLTAFEAMNDDATTVKMRTGFQYDFIDFIRQVVSNVFTDYHMALPHVLDLGNGTNKDEVRTIGETFVEIIEDLDDLMSCDVNFLLGKWVNDAKSIATSKQEEILFEFNAKSQVTVWGPNYTVGPYAVKPWGGLLRGYFAGEWKTFFQYLNNNFTGRPFDNKVATKYVFDNFDYPWTRNTTSYPSLPTTNCLAEGRRLYAKYVMDAPGNFTKLQGYRVANMTRTTVLHNAWHRDPRILLQLCSRIPTCKAVWNGTLYANAPELEESQKSTVYLRNE